MSVENFFIGREEEKHRMQSCIQSKDSRLVAVLGRRRVGKTYFIKKTLLDIPHFYFTGIQDVSRERLLIEFSIKINEMSGYAVPVKEPKDWFEAFALLK
ncbi:MAG TPA: ATPase, partial [Saprospiraceae bacterium]|nr:ATPase [Saprospiraceae bacterium]